MAEFQSPDNPIAACGPVDSYMIEVVNMRLNSLSRFMVLVIPLVSPRAKPRPIDHSSIMDPYLSLVYTPHGETEYLHNDILLVPQKHSW